MTAWMMYIIYIDRVDAEVKVKLVILDLKTYIA